MRLQALCLNLLVAEATSPIPSPREASCPRERAQGVGLAVLRFSLTIREADIPSLAGTLFRVLERGKDLAVSLFGLDE